MVLNLEDLDKLDSIFSDGGIDKIENKTKNYNNDSDSFNVLDALKEVNKIFENWRSIRGIPKAQNIQPLKEYQVSKEKQTEVKKDSNEITNVSNTNNINKNISAQDIYDNFLQALEFFKSSYGDMPVSEMVSTLKENKEDILSVINLSMGDVNGA
ncbi:hypothetical protein [Methanococcus voltae]|uniref:Uncharacterized protein n=1 Tax=Methanococcus voltae (strain ATCC BAA-1334 / A3) TaxID=456320 RepID=D7DRB1_METV3|nr:hypothetical protein [Methanococcus voltae]MCS3901048.1 hypothetical protein [Methanococcus voltae]